MKKLLILFLFLSTCVYIPEPRNYIERDFWNPNLFIIYEDGQQIGTLEKDFWEKDVWIIKKD